MKRLNALVPMALTACLVLPLLCAAGSGLSQAAEPIKIGTIFSITGWGGFIGTPQKEAFTALVEDINKNGGIDGRQLEFYYEDDQSIPTNAVIAATKLIRTRTWSPWSVPASPTLPWPSCQRASRNRPPLSIPGPQIYPGRSGYSA